jgi:prepilin-type processing-associated H-X9-DG protein
MGYRANGSTWMVWADWWDGGGRPVTHTRINQARSPSQLVLMDEDMEDLANPNVRYVAVGIESLGWGPSFDYSRYNGCCEARIHGGRHFTNGAPAGVYWEDIALRSGQTNILFVDGHVSLVDMTGLIESEGTQQAFFSYPWSAGAFYDLVWAPPTQRQEPSAPAGALWWRVPWW